MSNSITVGVNCACGREFDDIIEFCRHIKHCAEWQKESDSMKRVAEGLLGLKEGALQ